MEDVKALLKESVAELDRLLDARNVVGEPMSHAGTTIVPLVSYGFGFGAGGGLKREGATGGGTGGGGGIRPVAVIVIDAKGARVQPVHPPPGKVTGAIGEIFGRFAESRMRRRGEGTADDDA